MDSLINVWKNFFATWPSDLPQRGVVVAAFDEQIVFVSFLISDHVVMLERQAPDSVGGRKVLMPFQNIQAVKITDPVGNDVFTQAGFVAGGRQKPDPATEATAATPGRRPRPI